MVIFECFGIFVYFLLRFVIRLLGKRLIGYLFVLTPNGRIVKFVSALTGCNLWSFNFTTQIWLLLSHILVVILVYTGAPLTWSLVNMLNCRHSLTIYIVINLTQYNKHFSQMSLSMGVIYCSIQQNI